MVDPRNFLLSTDYPVDHVVCFFTGSIAVPAHTGGPIGTSVQQTIPHTLGFAPLLDGYVSTTPDFSSAVYGLGDTIPYTTGNWTPPGSGITQLFVNGVTVGANSTNLLVNATNSGDSNLTYYYELFGFMPSNINVDVEPTALQSSNPFVLNTDYNYCKLLVEGRAAIGAGATQTIPHNLGFIPQVSVWIENPSNAVVPNRTVKLNGSVESVGAGTPTDNSKVTVDETNVYITNYYASTVSYNYRVYADDGVVV